MKKIFHLIIALVAIGTLQSCQNEFQENASETNRSLNSSTIRNIDPSELNQMEEILKSEGITIPEDSTEYQTRIIVGNQTTVEVIKITCKSPNPNGNGSYVNMSGVLLVPKKSSASTQTNLSLMIAPPPTYTSNEQTPSNLFKKTSLVSQDSDLNMFYFLTLQARSGYAVLIPDYLGYGDSYKECVHPYLESKPMVESIINLTKAAQSTLSSNGYKYKKELVITGYSQGGFVAASLARELEINHSDTFPVKLLITGGTPCNLKQIVDIARQSATLRHTYFIPYALWGYQQNGYPEINTNSILQEPYASKLSEVFDGTHSSVNNAFSPKVSDLFTENFIKNLDTDPDLAYINQILDENSIKPWVNKCKFVMTHALKDISVYYPNATSFAEQQNASGGKVLFYTTAGDHELGIILYYLTAYPYFSLYK